MRIALATDAWTPQVNGVVRTLGETVSELGRRGIAVELVTPQRFLTVPLPGYAGLRIAAAPRAGVRRALARFAPEIVHIATEGPIGWAARGWCLANRVPFTTAFHTQFPEYAAVRTGLPAGWFWPALRRFHAPSRAVLVATRSLQDELAGQGFTNLRGWSRGIDHALFRPDGPAHPALARLPRPLLLSVGRIAPEKNLAAFLALDVPGTKVVVGDGPQRAELATRFPDTVFTGALAGAELAAAYRAADCFVFPSRTDTFGLVMIEALACGVPVAAYPVTGPRDILDAEVGGLDEDLARAVSGALACDRRTCAEHGARYSWAAATDQFLAALHEAAGGQRAVAASNTGAIAA